MNERWITRLVLCIVVTVSIGVTMTVHSQDTVGNKIDLDPSVPKPLFTAVPIKINFHPFSVARLNNEDVSSFDRNSGRPNPGEEPLPKQSVSDDGWHFAVAPYLYATGITGTIGARGRTIDINASFGDVLSHLKLPLMVTFEARKKRLFSLTDMVWVKLSDDRDTPGDLYASRKLGVNLFILDPEVGYRLIQDDKSSFDIFAGARIWSVQTNINVTSGRLPGFDVSQRKTWAAPVVGFRGSYNITPKLYFSTRMDVGGAGIGADLTTQIYAGLGYNIVPKVALVGGYRFFQVDYDDHSGFLFDTRMNGFVLGAKFSF